MLARGLHDAGMPQLVAAIPGTPLAERARELGLSVLAISRRASWNPGAVLRLLRAIGCTPRVLLHAHSSPALDLARRLKVHPRVAGVVYTRRTAFPVRRSRKYRTAADRYIAVSEAAGRRLLEAGMAPERLVLVPDCVDPSHVDPAVDAEYGALLESAGGPLVAAVGALTPEKGFDVLLDAWPEVLRRVPAAHLVIAGDGPLWKELLQRRLELRIRSSVRLLGYREHVGPLLARADLFVMPSRSEGLGSAALEAMWCGLPVVASNVGGLPEAVEKGVTGALVPPGDPRRLAEAVAELLSDPDRRRRMGKAARLRARGRYDPAYLVQRHLEAYRCVLGEGQSEAAVGWEAGVASLSPSAGSWTDGEGRTSDAGLAAAGESR